MAMCFSEYLTNYHYTSGHCMSVYWLLTSVLKTAATAILFSWNLTFERCEAKLRMDDIFNKTLSFVMLLDFTIIYPELILFINNSIIFFLHSISAIMKPNWKLHHEYCHIKQTIQNQYKNLRFLYLKTGKSIRKVLNRGIWEPERTFKLLFHPIENCQRIFAIDDTIFEFSIYFQLLNTKPKQT